MATGYYFFTIRMHLVRKNLGALLTGYFGPTATFAILSIFSFTIAPDQVTNQILFEKWLL